MEATRGHAGFGRRPRGDEVRRRLHAAPVQAREHLHRRSGRLSEDCLFLDLSVPRARTRRPCSSGFTAVLRPLDPARSPCTTGEARRSRWVVFVSINYRFGRSAISRPQLNAESPESVSGDYGLLDQIEALRWVKRNSPRSAAIPRTSRSRRMAGGLSVMYLLAAPPARGLFAGRRGKRYIVSTPELKEARFGEEAAEAIGTRVATALGAEDLAALRAVDAATMSPRRGGPLPAVRHDGRPDPARQLVDVFIAANRPGCPSSPASTRARSAR